MIASRFPAALTDEGRQALEPVRAALLASADERAQRLHAEAAGQASAIRQAAAAQADGMRARARAEGETAAQEAVIATLNRRRRQARGLVLAAQAQLYSKLVEDVTEAVRELSAGPEWPARAERLAGLALAALGPGATVTAARDGGLMATAGSRSLDLSVPALARLAVERLGDSVVRLWS